MYTNRVVEGKLDGVRGGVGRIASAKREEEEVYVRMIVRARAGIGGGLGQVLCAAR